MRRVGDRILMAVAAALILGAPGAAGAAFVTFEVGGDNTAASIEATVDAFAAALGDPNTGNDPGPLAGGRREINWDGGGSTATAVAGPVFTGFQNNRGALFTTPGTGFAQVPFTDVDLLVGNPTYDGVFSVFSPVRLFTATGSNITDVTFSIPGTGGAVAATVGGFGVVFTDVDLADSTQLLFFGIFGELLFSDFVSPGTVADGSLSFLGAIGDAGERIARVRIVSGNVAPGPDDNPTAGADVALMDDVLYREPQAVPEPSLAVLLTLGATAVMLRRKLGV